MPLQAIHVDIQSLTDTGSCILRFSRVIYNIMRLSIAQHKSDHCYYTSYNRRTCSNRRYTAGEMGRKEEREVEDGVTVVSRNVSNKIISIFAAL